MTLNFLQRPFGRFLPQLAFVLALLLGLGMTGAVFLAERRSALAEFDRTADLAVDRVVTRLKQHVILLRATRGLFAAADREVTRQAFSRFVTAIDLMDALTGVQGIGFARMIATADAGQAEAEIARHYNVQVIVRPETAMDNRAPIILLEPPDVRNLSALGYDMYADPVRRAAMDRAIATGEPQMTAPVELVQEITQDKQPGFLIYLPLAATGASDGFASAPVAGFVYAPFRSGDLIRAALEAGPPLAVALHVVDLETGTTLFDDTAGWGRQGLSVRRLVDVKGRTWAFDLFEAAPPNALRDHLGSILVGLTSLLFAAAAGLAIAARQHEAAQARELADAAARESEYRGLLLQEMKHRIKNHIARIQSISRQSARGATDVKAFTDAFDARLQAMASVQELLTGNATPLADLRAILRKELQQCLDRVEVEDLMNGPLVRLNERQSHAFALLVHELVTNAMKYGGLSPRGAGLRITWSLDRPTGTQAPEVVIDWRESFAVEEGDADQGGGTSPRGFGSRLIEASLKGELSGSIERTLREDGLHIVLRFPVDAVPGRA